MSALTNVDPEPILQRIQRGESLRTIAVGLGVSKIGLRAWLLREDAERYNDVITAALTQRVAEADEMLEDADSVLNVARAREIARFSRMDLERRRPHLYGQRTQVTVDIAPGLPDRLRAARDRAASVAEVTALPAPSADLIAATAYKADYVK